MSSEINRRFFIRQTLATLTGAAALSTGLTACSTLDNYLFDDHYDLKDQVLIIGGGISGLYLAYLLKQSKTEFRLLEGSNRFGGRIRSAQNYDLGASLYSNEDKLLKTLLNDFLINSESLDKKNFFIPNGMESVVSSLVDRISGLMPYRNLRLQWRAISIRKIDSSYEIVFKNPRGHRTFVCKRVVFALPPSQWSSIAGLLQLEELNEIKAWMPSLKSENILKVAFPLPHPARQNTDIKNILTFEDSLFEARQVIKKTKGLMWSEVDFRFSESGRTLELEKLNEFMKRKMNLNVNFNRLTSENYFDWKSTELIGAAYFKNALPWPALKNSDLQMIGDFATWQNPHTLEGALNSARSAFDKII